MAPKIRAISYLTASVILARSKKNVKREVGDPLSYISLKNRPAFPPKKVTALQIGIIMVLSWPSVSCKLILVEGRDKEDMPGEEEGLFSNTVQELWRYPRRKVIAF